MNKPFLNKLFLFFLLMAVASGVAGFCAWTYWNTIFVAIYGTTDYAKLSIEDQALKPPLNLIMYSMPAAFGCACAGFFNAAFIIAVIELVSDVKQKVVSLFSLMRSKDGHNA